MGTSRKFEQGAVGQFDPSLLPSIFVMVIVIFAALYVALNFTAKRPSPPKEIREFQINPSDKACRTGNGHVALANQAVTNGKAEI